MGLAVSKFWGTLYVLNINLLSNVWFEIILNLWVAFLLLVSFYAQILNFDEVQFIYFAVIVAYTFSVTSKKSWPDPISWSVFPIFSSKSFILLDLLVRYVTYFELIFVHNKTSTSLFSQWISRFPSTTVEERIFFNKNDYSWHFCWKSFVSMCRCWSLSSLFHSIGLSLCQSLFQYHFIIVL